MGVEETNVVEIEFRLGDCPSRSTLVLTASPAQSPEMAAFR